MNFAAGLMLGLVVGVAIGTIVLLDAAWGDTVSVP